MPTVVVEVDGKEVDRIFRTSLENAMKIAKEKANQCNKVYRWYQDWSVYVDVGSKMNGRDKVVAQFDLNHQQLNIFESAEIAARLLRLKARGIRDAARGNRQTCGGFRWKYI